MEEVSLHDISFRSINPPDMAQLEKWYAMTDELGYATGFKRLDEVREKLLSYPMTSMMIIHGEEQAAGFVCYELKNMNGKNVAWIHILLVDPAFQNRGIGSWTIRKLLEWFESMDTTAVVVSVSEQNHRGLKFWENLGFSRSLDLERILSGFGTKGVVIMKRYLERRCF
ncbi:MAG TPA: GNAT family N-acetyltransferase [Thermoclostridium caenicola]|uniref:Ribosomal protein S18 acetylase RimI n=1 Tax=Thermoclostridium caenicola TaxID=659425 RepID=A0A1M6FN93_9FIRM|nr:GNAT family N-acetyltransferase [Thermoclostridium caenicola]SHI99152.1 Ribosomal protein S18 acetylase RimI [Thermoclostridium caenicola]HOK42552.1 GNAT family N-acetyltransferase [Thermoclostridium caenicola]HOL84425.1 GNAT family N-acetyltransferase [Thermoclostridium caenicola]HPO76591.1 GNAT family N-acetyltransferase [Thermoclostridium caenicola]